MRFCLLQQTLFTFSDTASQICEISAVSKMARTIVMAKVSRYLIFESHQKILQDFSWVFQQAS